MTREGKIGCGGQKKGMAGKEWQMMGKGWLERKYAGSYTIETVWVMAVFCLVMVVLVQQAYRLHDETKNGMSLQEAVELVRHDEDERGEELVNEAKGRLGLVLSMDGVALEVEQGKKKAVGNISGREKGGKWNLEISSGVYEPEEFLRKLAALKQLEERYERQIQEGNAP